VRRSKTALNIAMGLKRPTSKKTSKADTSVAEDVASESRQAPTDRAGTPDITLPSLAQDYLQNKNSVMELLLTLTKALKEEREARQIVQKQLADMQKHVEQLQQTARQHAVQLPDTVRFNLDRDIEEMFFER
jgi:phage shock protein A